MTDTLFKILTHRTPLRLALAKWFIKQFSLFSYEDRLSIGAIDRPQYGYCIFQAARLASLLKYPKISVIEFGCGGGNGLLNAEMHITAVKKIFAVDIELYGFDCGSGLPSPRDYRDMPHYFRAGLYDMRRDSLEPRLKLAELVIGDTKDTCATFLQDCNPAPIGCMLHDLDFYSSTRDALTMFDAEAAYFLPRVFLYFDDIIGDEIWLCNEFTGERLAMEEFNQIHKSKKICEDYFLTKKNPGNVWWHNQIYIYHDFDHPRYNDFIADRPQKGHAESIRLK